MGRPPTPKLPKRPNAPKRKPAVDWATIREEWEQQDVSDRQLADRWGFKSKNSIIRRRTEEGWTRNIDAIAARLVTEAVARSAHVPHGLDVSVPVTPVVTEPVTNPLLAAEARSQAEGRSHERSHDVTREGTARSRQQDRDNERDLGTAQNLAAIHARAIRQQIALGDSAINTAVVFLDRLAALATSEDGSEIADARSRLLALNPDKDTLAGIVKAMGGLLDIGVKIKRMALGMDVEKTPATPQAVAGGRAASEVIKRLDVDTLMKMRGVAQEMSRLAPPVIEGVADDTNEGE